MCGYIRWELEEGTFKSSLLTSKSRITLLKIETHVRLELAATVLSKRLRISVVNQLRFKFNQISSMSTWSECVDIPYGTEFHIILIIVWG